MAKRFVFAFVKFVGLVIPAAFFIAFLAAPAQPQPLVQPGCERDLADAAANLDALHASLQHLGKTRSAESCAATQRYFLEAVKARAVTAACKTGAERERELGRLDADVETINQAIAASCN